MVKVAFPRQSLHYGHFISCIYETTTLALSYCRSCDLTHVFDLKRQADISMVSHTGRPNEGERDKQQALSGTVVLGLRALINQSSPVYAYATTAWFSLCPYQLKESSQQSIILLVTRHVTDCVYSHLCVCTLCVHVIAQCTYFC